MIGSGQHPDHDATCLLFIDRPQLALHLHLIDCAVAVLVLRLFSMDGALWCPWMFALERISRAPYCMVQISQMIVNALEPSPVFS